MFHFSVSYVYLIYLVCLMEHLLLLLWLLLLPQPLLLHVSMQHASECTLGITFPLFIIYFQHVLCNKIETNQCYPFHTTMYTGSFSLFDSVITYVTQLHCLTQNPPCFFPTAALCHLSFCQHSVLSISLSHYSGIMHIIDCVKHIFGDILRKCSEDSKWWEWQGAACSIAIQF